MAFRIKPDWIPFLHRFRRREMDRCFAGCPEGAFRSALEIGAGDGFQSRLLTRWAARVLATDHDPSIESLPPAAGVTWRRCDAEAIDTAFAGQRFDLIFSSSLLEHLPEPGRALRACQALLADDGVTIHVVPAPFWKVTHLLLHAPNRAVLILERLLQPGGPARALRRLSGRRDASPSPPVRDNNPFTSRPRRSSWTRWIVPAPHGVSRGHLAEFLAFRKARWSREMVEAGFELLAVRKGPVASGYGFGLERTRRLLEALGLASEYIYIARRRGAAGPAGRNWKG